MSTLAAIGDIIILIGAVLVGITTIYKFFSNAGKGVRNKVKQVQQAQEQTLNEAIDERLKTVLPDILKQHDLEIREKYLSDRLRYLTEIKNEVVRNISGELEIVSQHEASMCMFSEVLKELLRERIMTIYSRKQHRRQLEEHEKVQLDKAYQEYKQIGGNSYIDDYYERMMTWEIVPDDYED